MHIVRYAHADLAVHNPFQYRGAYGYIYDYDFEFYYLKNRFYNPDLARFISPDKVLGKVGVVFSHNLYAYCAGNPVMRVDPDGLDSLRLIFCLGRTKDHYRGHIEIQLNNTTYSFGTFGVWNMEWDESSDWKDRRNPKYDKNNYDMVGLHFQILPGVAEKITKEIDLSVGSDWKKIKGKTGRYGTVTKSMASNGSLYPYDPTIEYDPEKNSCQIWAMYVMRYAVEDIGGFELDFFFNEDYFGAIPDATATYNALYCNDSTLPFEFAVYP